MNLKPLILACVLVIAATVAGAEQRMFEKIDKDKDGKINHEELSYYMKENAFEKIDNNRDERITLSEWDKTHDVAAAEKYKETFQSMDRDRDSRISYPEFSSYADKYSNIEDAFMIMDKNKDGALSPDEVSYIPSFRLFTIHF